MRFPRWLRLTLRFAFLVVMAFLVFSGVSACWAVATAYFSIKDRYLWSMRLTLPDYGLRSYFKTANAGLSLVPERTVFIGDSITAGWDLSASFPGRAYVNRGIPGQNSTQVLLRFRQDVIDLKPSTVVILTGVNDLNFGQSQDVLQMVEENDENMADLAMKNQIRPIFATILPVNSFVSHPHPFVKTHPNAAIVNLNGWLRVYCAQRGIAVVDFASALKDPNGELRSGFSDDGLHPNAAGYRAMKDVLEETLH